LPERDLSEIELTRSEPSSIAQVQNLNEAHAIDASTVRDIFTQQGTVDAGQSPAEVRVRGVWIRGELDLDGLVQPQGRLRLTGCLLDEPLKLRDATLGGLTLEQCVLPGAWADRAQVDGLTIERCLVTGKHADGALRFAGAHVATELRLTGTQVYNSGGPAVLATGLAAGGGIFMDALAAVGVGAIATVRLSGATISGQLSLDGATVTSSRPIANVTADPVEPEGALDLAGATIGKDLLLRGATLTAHAGPALRADHLTVNGDTFRCEHRNKGFLATGTGRYGAVFLAAATLNGQLSLSGAVLTNDSGPALLADSVTVQGDMLLDEGFTATGGGRGRALVSLIEARIGKDLTCSGRTIGGTRSALVLDLSRAKVGNLLLSSGFAADPEPGHPVLNFDGLTYAGLPVLLTGNPPVPLPEVEQAAEWISYFRDRAVYSAQAYRQLAAAYAGQGDAAAARRIGSAQRDDARVRGQLSRLGQARERVLGMRPARGRRGHPT
jgi:hypothetical protein